jgi:hypothetical protein
MIRGLLLAWLAGSIILPVRPAAGEMVPGEAVVGLSVAGDAKAYPLSLFLDTPVINDLIGRMAVVVFYDQGTGRAAAYFRLIGGEPLEFSGQAAGTVADDLTTATRWDMLTGEAVSGNLAGMKMVPIRALLTNLSDWRSSHPRSALFMP